MAQGFSFRLVFCVCARAKPFKNQDLLVQPMNFESNFIFKPTMPAKDKLQLVTHCNAYFLHRYTNMQILISLNFHIIFIIVVFNHISMHEAPRIKTIPHCLHLKAALPSFPLYTQLDSTIFFHIQIPQQF